MAEWYGFRPEFEPRYIFGAVSRSSHIICLTEYTVLETKASLKVLRTSVKRVLIYSKIEKAILCSLPWAQVANFVSKGAITCSDVPTIA